MGIQSHQQSLIRVFMIRLLRSVTLGVKKLFAPVHRRRFYYQEEQVEFRNELDMLKAKARLNCSSFRRY